MDTAEDNKNTQTASSSGNKETTVSKEDELQTTGGKPLTKQSKLRFSLAPGSGEKVVGQFYPASLDINLNTPKWIEPLLPYFELVTRSVIGGHSKYTMSCLSCRNNSSKSGPTYLTDKCASNFIRHLERHHKQEHQKFEDSKAKVKEAHGIPLYQQTLSNNVHYQPYDSADHRQKRFHKDLINFITMDMVPLSIVHGQGFQRMIHGLDKRISLPHRITVDRWITEEYKKIHNKIKEDLESMPEGSLHFIIDIWTSQQGHSILGFKVQFVDDWKVKQLVVGFKHFPEAHTSDNIKTMLAQFLGTDMGLTPNKIGTVTADNAANMIGAFKKHEITLLVRDQTEEHDDCDGWGILGDGQDDIGKLIEEQENMKFAQELDFTENEGAPNSVISGIELWANTSLRRNACLAHLLQLAVKDAINNCSFMVSFSKKVSEVATFFSNSPKYQAKLRQKSNGLSIVRPVVTRWNSLHYSLKRILRADEKVNMRKAINDTLAEAKGDKQRKSKVPTQFYDEEMESAFVVSELLEPCSELTDKLQADGVTSSIVILAVLNTVRDIMTVAVDSDLQHFDEIAKFKEDICGNIKMRFAYQPENKQQKENRGKKQVMLNVFHDKSYIIASILDYRIKTTCFDESLTKNTTLEGVGPTKAAAVEVLREAYEAEKIVRTSPESKVSLLTDELISEPPKKKGMFSIISDVPNKELTETVSNTEIDDYLQMPLQSGSNVEKICPLQFWKGNEFKFPVLSRLARIHLGMPASSGSIERLFSVAAGMGKARNARLNPETTERLLCCKFYNMAKFQNK